MLLKSPTECVYKGEIYQSGAEWVDEDDPCSVFKCVAGVITESITKCYTACSNPLKPLPGQCCSSCLGKNSCCFFFFSVDRLLI